MSMSNILESFQHLCAAQRTITLLNKSQILNSIIILLQKEAHNPTDKQIAQRRDNDIKQNRLTGSAFLFFSPKSPRLPFSKALPLSGLVPPHAYTFPSEEQLQSLYSSIHPSILSLLLFFLLLLLLRLSPHPVLRLGGFQLDGLGALLVALETATCSLHGGTNVSRAQSWTLAREVSSLPKSTALVQPKDEAASPHVTLTTSAHIQLYS